MGGVSAKIRIHNIFLGGDLKWRGAKFVFKREYF